MSAIIPSSDVAFTASVKAIQERRGSRKAYRRMEERGGWETRVTSELAAFLAERDSAYLATATSAGQPYIQHRGGPKGFIRVLDDRRLALQTSSAIGSTTRPATSPRTTARSCS